jgi:hypothetical protein
MHTTVISLLLIASTVSAVLSYNRVQLVDFNTTTNQFLFRGNYPYDKSEKEFDYPTLISYIKKRAFEEHITLPQEFKFVDITFLHSIGNYFEYHLEKNFFDKNPQLGSIVHWTIIGHPINASSLSESVRKTMVKAVWDWNYEDQLIERSDALYKFVHTKNNATVYYMHCNAGVDRTGEVSGSYLMRYKKWSYIDTLKYDYEIGGRPLRMLSQNAMNWYCWWLHYTFGLPSDCMQGI